MESINFSEFRNNLASLADQSCKSHEPIIVTRQKSDPIVVISLEDYPSMEETFYLLKLPKNAKRLYEAINDLENGKHLLTPDLNLDPN